MTPPAETTGGEDISPVKAMVSIIPELSICSYNTYHAFLNSQSGLGLVPADFQNIWEEIGLAGPSWTNLGKNWHALGALWLHAEGQLMKLGRANFKFDEIQKSSLPEPLKDWMYSKLMRQDAARPQESFGNIFTDYIQRLPWKQMTKGDNVVEQA